LCVESGIGYWSGWEEKERTTETNMEEEVVENTNKRVNPTKEDVRIRNKWRKGV